MDFIIKGCRRIAVYVPPADVWDGDEGLLVSVCVTSNWSSSFSSSLMLEDTVTQHRPHGNKWYYKKKPNLQRVT